MLAYQPHIRNGNTLMPKNEAMKLFKKISRREKKIMSKNGAGCPVLCDVDSSIRDMILNTTNRGEFKNIYPGSIIGLVYGTRRNNYSSNFLPLPNDDTFRDVWVNIATRGDFLDSGVIALVPVQDKYFAIDTVIKTKGAQELLNSHYYATVAKATGKQGVRALVFDYFDKDFTKRIVESNSSWFFKQETTKHSYWRMAINYLSK